MHRVMYRNRSGSSVSTVNIHVEEEAASITNSNWLLGDSLPWLPAALKLSLH